MNRQQRWQKVCKSLLNVLIFLSVWSFNSAEEVERTVWWTTAVIHLWKIILFGSFHQQLRKSCCIYFKGEFKNLKILISLQSLARSWRVLSQSAFTNAWWAGRQYSLQSQNFWPNWVPSTAKWWGTRRRRQQVAHLSFNKTFSYFSSMWKLRKYGLNKQRPRGEKIGLTVIASQDYELQHGTLVLLDWQMGKEWDSSGYLSDMRCLCLYNRIKLWLISLDL